MNLLNFFTYTESAHIEVKWQNIGLSHVVSLIFIVCVIFLTPHRIAIAETVRIPDPNLRTALELALGKEVGADITQTDMVSLESLDAFESGIRNLTGLEFASNLVELRLGDNRILDLSPLEGLKNLVVLDLHLNRRILDLTPLKSLTNLTWLSLRVNQIADVSPLKDLAKLTYLNLDDNYKISDVSPFKDLTNLRYLSLDENQISDVSPLKNLTNLRFLALDDNKISDVSPLKNLTNLRELDLNDNKNISDVSPLKNMTNLTFLELHGNKISDISSLKDIINLNDLRLQENQILDVSPLKDLINLTYLDLHDNKIYDVSPLKNLTNLKYLDLRDNKILDFSPLIRLIDNLEEYYTDQLTKSVDVNRDGVVNIKDLVIIASNFHDPDLAVLAQMNIYPDVNGNGVVDIIDLLIVASEMGTTDDAAPVVTNNLVGISSFTAANLTQWIRIAKQLETKEPHLQKGIAVLEHLLELLRTVETLPKATALLQNYPNPFNPETWIPYQLSKPAKVSISIYSADGKHLRKLELGQLPVGIYQDKSRAAYWDGRNELGETVASGVYFYTLIAGDFTATGKMFIRK